MTTLTQVLLRKNQKDGARFLVGWVRTPHAVIGKRLKIKDGSTWDSPWIVENVYSSEKKEFVKAREREYAKHRGQIDVSRDGKREKVLK
jgi:hypothetical protein